MVTTFIALAFITQFMQAVDTISIGIGVAATDAILKLAIFHTFFNVVGVMVMVPFISQLVYFLEDVLGDRSRGVGEARFLNDAALELPDTAIKAILRETRRLYNNATDLMGQGIGIHDSRLLTAKDDLEETLSQKKVVEIDLEKAYQNSIGGLYGSIVEFSVRAQS
ncbi:MAG: Na/Pi cotransporter family protein, partial [Magnetococcales bacterium]|nr:Na/Pi cotransporter family protein [Magnetococcales bacterium]